MQVGAECLPVSGPRATLAENHPEPFCAVKVTFLFLFESIRLYGNESVWIQTQGSFYVIQSEQVQGGLSVDWPGRYCGRKE